ncbi:rhamnosyltransferase [Methylobacterium brachiatum]
MPRRGPLDLEQADAAAVGRARAAGARPVPEPTLGRLMIGITLFRPSPDQVDRVLAQAVSGCAGVIAFDDGGLAEADAERLTRAGVTVLSAGRNLGIAEALNRIAAAARAAGAETLLLLDQDAEPETGLAAALLAARERLRAAAIPVAVVGPAPAPAAGHKAPAYPPRPGAPACGALSPACAPVQFLATSGSLIDLDALARIGPFRADFFIDGVELEWCFRAWSLGYGCYLARDVAIPHRVGGGVIRGFGIAMPRQPLFRMATYLRNAVYAWRLPHVPLRWKLAQAAYLPFQAGLYWADSGWRLAVLLRLLGAVRDGALGRLGPPRDRP